MQNKNYIRKHVSRGNHKVGKDTLIFNLEPALNCTADKLGLCKTSKTCYAKRPEVFRPTVLPYRLRQQVLWSELNSDEDLVLFADSIATKHPQLLKQGKIKYFRFNESGSIASFNDIIKLYRIAGRLWDTYKIKTYGYTTREDLIESFPKHKEFFVIQTSNFKHKDFNSFVQVTSFTNDKTSLKCKGFCLNCKICKTNHGKTIEVKSH